jgi:hypothetical protein
LANRLRSDNSNRVQIRCREALRPRSGSFQRWKTIARPAPFTDWGSSVWSWRFRKSISDAAIFSGLTGERMLAPQNRHAAGLRQRSPGGNSRGPSMRMPAPTVSGTSSLTLEGEARPDEFGSVSSPGSGRCGNDVRRSDGPFGPAGITVEADQRRRARDRHCAVSIIAVAQIERNHAAAAAVGAAAVVVQHAGAGQRIHLVRRAAPIG